MTMLAIVAGAGALALYEMFGKKKPSLSTDQPQPHSTPQSDQIPPFHPGVMPPGNPPGSPPPANPMNLPISPTSPQANAQALTIQPQPGYPPQPPLPPPPATPLATGMTGTVNTSQTGQAGALMVRSQPSTQAAPVGDGDPGQGGGFDHGQTIRITGPMNVGFYPVLGTSRKGSSIQGYSWAAYIKGAQVSEAAAAAAASAHGEGYTAPLDPAFAGEITGESTVEELVFGHDKLKKKKMG